MSIIKQNLRLFLISLLLLSAVGISLLMFAHDFHLTNSKLQHYQKQKLLLEERIDKKYKILHSATLVLANNSTLREALAYEDRDTIIEEMQHLRAEFAKWTGFVNYAFHVITHDGRSLYRNYDDAYGADVSGHPMMKLARADLTKAVTQVAKGGYGNVYRVVNIQPVFALDDAEQLVGFMTVSQGLKQIVQEFKADGYDYYVFEREQRESAEPSSRFVIDTGAYFANRKHSDWTFEEADLDHQTLQIRDGWYYQTLPIYGEHNQLQAFHLIAAPIDMINNQAWSQTRQVFGVLITALLIILIGGMSQLALLKRNVVKPMRQLTKTLKTIIENQRYDQQVAVERNDEIGHMTELFNRMLVRTDSLIFDLKYQKMAIDQTLIISRANRFGTITYVNENFCKISGYSEQELIGKPHNIVRHPDMDKAVFAEMWQTIQAKQTWQGEVQNKRKDGSSYYVMSYIIPILDRQGEIQEYLSIREDITLIVQLRQGMQAALFDAEKEKKLAQQANQAKSEFLASMSHELRTPLNAIIGFAQLLEMDGLSDAQGKQVKTILRSAKHLLSLINDILDFAKLDSGKVQFNFESIDVSDVMREVQELTDNQRTELGIQLDIQPIGHEVEVYVDRLRFKQVLLNLISNAIKYNKPNGTISLSCAMIERNQKCYWQLRIKDTGIGIAKANLKKLFEPFNRLGHEASTIEGTGIGLSITKDLIEQMHGWIEVQSELGVGTEFIVSLPISKWSDQTDASEKVAQPVVESEPLTRHELRVLYIENDPVCMQIMAQAVQTLAGVQLKIAPTALNGLEQAQAWLPDMIFIDIGLPDMAGQALLTQLKTELEPTLSQTTFYAITADDSQLADLNQSGFESVIIKPVKLDDITPLIQAHMSRESS